MTLMLSYKEAADAACAMPLEDLRDPEIEALIRKSLKEREGLEKLAAALDIEEPDP